MGQENPSPGNKDCSRRCVRDGTNTYIPVCVDRGTLICQLDDKVTPQLVPVVPWKTAYLQLLTYVQEKTLAVKQDNVGSTEPRSQHRETGKAWLSPSLAVSGLPTVLKCFPTKRQLLFRSSSQQEQGAGWRRGQKSFEQGPTGP